MIRRAISTVFGVGCLLGLAATAHAQASPDPLATPWNDARLRFGPVYFNPTFSLKNVGIDKNVFDDAQFARQDFTGTLVMRSEGGIHFSNVFLLTLGQETDYVYFRRYTSERSIDGSLSGSMELRTRPIHPWLSVSKVQTHDRTGLEIDARAGRQQPTVDVGSDFKIGTRIGATAAWEHSSLKYAASETFDGVDLGTALDDKSDTYRVLGRYSWTEFTDLVGGAEFGRERFVFSPVRNSDSRYYYGGIESKQDAAMSGSGNIGYRIDKHLDPTVPEFRGIVANGTFSFVVKDRAQFQWAVDRAPIDSYEDQYPYYVQQGGFLQVNTRLDPHFDIITAAKSEWLVYRELTTAAPQPRTDRDVILDLGFGYFIGGVNGTRVGLTVERAQRYSPIADRNYHTTRILSNMKFSF